MSLAERLRRHLDETSLLEGASHVLIACSAGGDSTALLVLLAEVLPREMLAAAHIHHLLRETGNRDARAVADLAASLQVPFGFRPVEVSKLRSKGESLEAAARRLRYHALFALADALGPGTLIATGHTLDDQAETVLLNLARHSGRARGGIRARRQDGVVRPLLPFTRAELRSFLSDRGIAWQEDETNSDPRFLRNRIRHHVLPSLEVRWPGVAVRLARAGDAWTRRLTRLDTDLDGRLERHRAPAGGPWPRGLLLEAGPEGAGRLLLRAASIAGKPPGRAQLRRVLSRLSAGDCFAESLGGLRLVADRRSVSLRPPVPGRTRRSPDSRTG